MKKILSLLLLGICLIGCEKDELEGNYDHQKFYTIYFDRSPGKFYLRSGSQTDLASSRKFKVSAKVNYIEYVDGEFDGRFSKVVDKEFKTDSAGKLSLQFDKTGSGEVEKSREQFGFETRLVTMREDYGRDYIRIGKLESLDFTIEMTVSEKKYVNTFTLSAEEYFWAMGEGFLPFIESTLPEYEARSSKTYTRYGNIKKDWFIKLVGNIYLDEVY